MVKLLWAFFAAAFVLVQGEEVASDIGNWTVDPCIMAQFASTLRVNLAPAVDLTLETEVPLRATVNPQTSTCVSNKAQQITVKWTDMAKNDSTVNLFRNLTVMFILGNDSVSYGVSRIYGSFQVSQFVQFVDTVNKTETVYGWVDTDTGEFPNYNPLFRTPTNRSFLCFDVGEMTTVTSRLHYTFPNFPSTHLFENSTTLTLKHVQMDAFRPKDAPKHMFQVPVDCDYKPNDVVPIIVGVVLALLVVAIVVAYIIGRRRMRQSGYENISA